MELYARSSITTGKKFSFTQRIEQFSSQLCRFRPFTGPEFREYSGCKWRIIIDERNGALHLMINRDARGDGSESPLANVKLSVVDCFGCTTLNAQKVVHFGGSNPVERILSVEKHYLLSDYCGLNRWRFLPDDTLTLRCEITAHEYCNETFDQKEDFENSFRNSSILKRVGVRSALRFFGLFLLFSLSTAVVLWLVTVLAYAVTQMAMPVLQLFASLVNCLIPFIVFIITGKLVTILRENTPTRQVVGRQIERRQIALSGGRGVARYDAVRSVSYLADSFHRYN